MTGGPAWVIARSGFPPSTFPLSTELPSTKHSPSRDFRVENRALIKVQVRPNESLESALRRFKRQCNYSGIFRLFKSHTWHEKRSDKRRRERRERLRTVLKAARRSDPNFRGRNNRRRPSRARRARRTVKRYGSQGEGDSQRKEGESSENRPAVQSGAGNATS
jgi:small subunit ribosomal protein S21